MRKPLRRLFAMPIVFHLGFLSHCFLSTWHSVLGGICTLDCIIICQISPYFVYLQFLPLGLVNDSHLDAVSGSALFLTFAWNHIVLGQGNLWPKTGWMEPPGRWNKAIQVYKPQVSFSSVSQQHVLNLSTCLKASLKKDSKWLNYL